jgi:hypothetical protein
VSCLDNLELLEKEAESIYDKIEEIVKSVFSEASRFTNNYWFEELGVFLDIELLN